MADLVPQEVEDSPLSVAPAEAVDPVPGVAAEAVGEDPADAAPEAIDPQPDDRAAFEARVHAALDRALESPALAGSPRLAAFLRFVVETTLKGRAEEIKGYTIAVEALGRPHSFDPQSDPIVRVEATRLRRALEHFYAAAGADEPLEIVIPKGSYVPLFRERAVAAERTADPAALSEGGPVPGAAGVALPAEASPESAPAEGTAAARGRLSGWLANRPRAVAAGLAAGVLLGLLAMSVPSGLRSAAEPHGSALQAVGLPLVEVLSFDATGPNAPDRGELRAMEVRLRDAFARFDFADVKDGDDRLAAARCRAAPSRSIFTLAALAEGREDGGFSLLLRLSDACDGVIVWSGALEGLYGGARLPESEARVVREISGMLMETHGVVLTRARTQARTMAFAETGSNAPTSAFGCVAEAFAVLGEEDGAEPTAARACFSTLAEQDAGFGLVHAVKAALMLHQLTGDVRADSSRAEAADMLHEAELAVELEPASAYAARTLALVQVFVGEGELAYQSARRALELNPLDYDVAASAGAVFIAAGRVDEGAELIRWARAQGAAATSELNAYLALAAFLRGDRAGAQALIASLELHPSLASRLALALAFKTLDRPGDMREAIHALVRVAPRGADGVRHLVHRMLASQDLADRALTTLEASGLSPQAASDKPPHG